MRDVTRLSVPALPCLSPRQMLSAMLTTLLAACVLTMAAGPAAAASKLTSILVDATDGRVLEDTNADLQRYPASLTKMMTLYLTFEALDEGRVSLDQQLSVSPRAAAQSPTKLGLRAGQTIPLESAVLGLVTKSANDAAMVLAENIAGTEENFAVKMTGKAHALGMTQTVFRNASGLPDPDQVTTARDMSTLALSLLYHYPHYYHYFSVKEFYYKGRPIANHNRLLGVCDGVDGIKTGYTRASGFNLVASAQRGNRRLIGVVLGAPSSQVRNAMMTDLLEQGFRGEPNIQLASVSHYLNGGGASSEISRDIAAARDQVAYVPASARLGAQAVGSASKSMRTASKTSATCSKRKGSCATAARSASKSKPATKMTAISARTKAKSPTKATASKATPSSKKTTVASSKPAKASAAKPKTVKASAKSMPVAARKPKSESASLARR